MAKEVLSESEIDKLLGLLAEDAPSNEAVTKEQMSQDEIDKALGVSERRYFHYDFKRPHKFSNYATQQIEKRFEKAALYMTDQLYKRTGLKCSFSSVVSDELTYEEFLRCVKRPTFFGSYQDSTPHSSSHSKCYSVISKICFIQSLLMQKLIWKKRMKTVLKYTNIFLSQKLYVHCMDIFSQNN